MTVGTVGFVKERLSQAREVRGLTIAGLAELVGVSAAAISHYEKGDHTPRPEVLATLGFKLNISSELFLKTNPVSKQAARLYWRSLSAATKYARIRAVRRFEWFVEVVDYLGQFFDFPESRVPTFDIPTDFRQIDSALIESAAMKTRQAWGLGVGPIPDVIRTLEANGVIVALCSMQSEHLDAFSEFDSNNRAYICLGTDKKIMVRRRFDAAHELAHLVLHRDVDRRTLNKATDFRLIENQAHAFANAFLLPSQSFVNELFTPTLDGFRALKSRWKVSIAAMIYRSKDLGLIGEDQSKRLWINLNRRDWRTFEPMDDLPVEMPQTIMRCFKTLVEQKIRTKEQILSDLRFPSQDIEELTGLPVGFLSREQPSLTDPVLKPQLAGNVVTFRARPR